MASSRDLDILAWTMLGEAGGEGRDGMADVGHVILNRLETGKYGSSISDVALANKQFSTWNKGEGGNDPQGRYPKSSREFQQARQLAEQVVSGAIPGPPGKPLDYHTPDISPYWASSKDRYGTYERNGHLYYPSQPVPPGEIPNVVASQTDTQRPGIVGNSERPTSALSAAYPTQNATPRLAPQMDGIYAYTPDDMQKAQITPGLGSLTPDFFKPQFTPSRLPPEAPMSFAALDRGPRSRADVPLPQPRPSRAVTGFPTPLPGYQSGPQVRLPEIAASPGYNRMDAMAGMPSNAMRQELALQGQSYAGMDRAPSSGVGRPPATRTVPSVPVRPTQTAAVDGIGYMPTMGLMRATLGSTPKPSPAPTPTTAIPGPNALPKGNEQLVAGIYPPEPVPSAFPAVGTAIDVVPQVIPRVPIGPGLPPAPLPRPLRTGVNVQMPTPMGQRPTLPMPRPVTGFPTALAQRPIPAPTLRVTVNGANSYNAGSSGGSSGGSQPQTIRGSSTGREYNVGQQYQAGGYLFEARPDGTFKNLGRV